MLEGPANAAYLKIVACRSVIRSVVILFFYSRVTQRPFMCRRNITAQGRNTTPTTFINEISHYRVRSEAENTCEIYNNKLNQI